MTATNVGGIEAENATMTDQGTESGSLTDAAKQKSSETLEQALQIGDTIQQRVADETDVRSTQAGEQVASLGEAMRDASSQLRGQGNDLPAAITEQIAERADQVGRYLRETDGRQILDDVQAFAKEQPWLVAAVGLAAGIAAARLLKASSRSTTGEATRRPALPASPAAAASTTTPYGARSEDVTEARYPQTPGVDAPPSGVAPYPPEERA